MSKGKYERKRERAKQRAKQERAPIGPFPQKNTEREDKRHAPENSDDDRQTKEEHKMRLRELLKRPSLTDYVVATFTVVLAVVAVFQGIFMYRQVTVMRSDERAWLKLTTQPDANNPDKTTIPITVGQPVNYPFQIANIGKTAATNIDARLYYSILDASQDVPVDEVDNASTYPYNHITAGIVYPNDVMKQIGTRPQKGGAPLLATKDEVEGIRDGKKYLAVFGIVSYDDVFGKGHWSKFCNWIAGNGDFQAESCTRFNSVGDR
jgi:hypothetical protein